MKSAVQTGPDTTPAADRADSPSDAGGTARPTRILFLPGCFRSLFPHSARTVAQQIAVGRPDAEVRVADDLLLDDEGRCQRFHVGPPGMAPEFEVVEVGYDDLARERAERRSLAGSVLAGVLTLSLDLHRILPILWLGDDRLTPAQRRSVRLMFAGFLIMLAGGLSGFALGVAAFGKALVGLLPDGVPATGDGGGIATELTAGLLAFFGVAAVVKTLFASKRLVDVCGDLSRSIATVVAYQTPGDRLHERLTGRLRSALRASLDGVDPDSAGPVAVMGYSQGALIAVDTLLPDRARTAPGRAPPVGPPAVSLLVTFGCPLLIVERLWPERPQSDRSAWRPVERWINFHADGDALGGPVAPLVGRPPGCGLVEDRDFLAGASEPAALRADHFSYWSVDPGELPSIPTRLASTLLQDGG